MIIDPTFCGSRFSTGRLLAIKDFTLDGTVLKESADLVILGVTFDAKMTFEKHLRSGSSAAAQRLGIM